MKKLFTIILLVFSSILCLAQSPRLYEHDFPYVGSQDEKVLEMLNQVNEDQIFSDIEHLSSYINRRADAIHIYDVKNWLISQYEELNIDSVHLHYFEVLPIWDTVPRPFTTAPNVLAFKRGTKYPNEFVVCGAHYDSFVITEGEFDPDTLVSPGADDNASGVAGILSTARILSNYDFERSIIFANWNAEEYGLCGSYAYAKDCYNANIDIVAYFNLDMTGYLNPGDNIHIHLLYKNNDSLIGKFVKQVSRTYFPNIQIAHAWLTGGDTDYSAFYKCGYQAVSPSEDVHNMSPYIHSVNDILGLSVNNLEQAAIFTKLNLACVAHAAGIIHESVNEIEFTNEIIDRYEVFDVFGRLVKTRQNVSENMEEIDLNNLQSGIYIIRLFVQGGNVVTKKFFVKY